MTLQYRDATMADLPEIVRIYNSTIASRMVTADTEPVTTESRVAWFNAHGGQHRPLWMVEHGRETVGWMSYQSFYGRPAYRETAEISIYIEEKERGKGYGRMMLQYAMDACADLGIKTLLGYIFAHNHPSMKLFTGLGFEPWGHLPRIARLDGIERDVIIAGKRINP